MTSITENKVHECNHPHSSYIQYIYNECEDVTQGWLIDIEGIMTNINYCPFCGIKLDMEGEISNVDIRNVNRNEGNKI